LFSRAAQSRLLAAVSGRTATLPQHEQKYSEDVQRGRVYINGFISPTHKRTERRAPVWDSEFTIKVAILKGDSADLAATLNAKLWDSVVVRGVLPAF
jgi:hypothetical protein